MQGRSRRGSAALHNVGWAKLMPVWNAYPAYLQIAFLLLCMCHHRLSIRQRAIFTLATRLPMAPSCCGCGQWVGELCVPLALTHLCVRVACVASLRQFEPCPAPSTFPHKQCQVLVATSWPINVERVWLPIALDTTSHNSAFMRCVLQTQWRHSSKELLARSALCSH